jgi:microcin C transport system ATP-binding protein
LAQLQRDRGLSFVLITHDIAVIRAMAHQVMVLKNGAVVEMGGLTDVLDRPQHPYTQTLLAASQ